MAYPRCKTCPHWRRSAESLYPYDDADLRSFFHRPGQQLGLCGAVEHNSETPIGAGPLASAECLGEGIGGQLITDANYGCVLHPEARVG